jgi:hypothetical protein
VGSTYFNVTRLSGSSTSLQLPVVLPTGTYKLYAQALFYTWTGSGNSSLSGANGSWEAPHSVGLDGGSGVAHQSVQLLGTAIGGQQPSVTWSLSGGGGLNDNGTLTLWAVRVA